MIIERNFSQMGDNLNIPIEPPDQVDTTQDQKTAQFIDKRILSS